MAKNNSYTFREKFEYSELQDKYTFQLKEHNRKWLWLLLLLLLPLLLIRCERDIKVHTEYSQSGNAIAYEKVSIDYSAHYLLKDGVFLKCEPIHREIETDEKGNGVFKKLPCSVFSYIFYAFSRATYNVKDDCHSLEITSASSVFHYTWNHKLKMTPKMVEIKVMVIDRETDDPLAGATLYYEYVRNGDIYMDSITTDPAGFCSIKDVSLCGEVKLSRVGCYGYADTTDVLINVKAAVSYLDSSTVRLTPLKQSFSYFVKNKFTKEPVPGAVVEVILTTNNGSVVRGKSVTNVDGKGFGVYEDAFVLATVELKASKPHYKDGHLENSYTVEVFAALPDAERTVYLEPEPDMKQFQNVDSITGIPLSGVRNDIHIKSVSGKREDLVEYSNRNGIFYVKAIEGDYIEILSDLSPYYVPKETVIEKFKEGEIIKMRPKMVDLVFRTIDGESGEVLPECDLNIHTSKSNVRIPISSGNGVFTVSGLYIGETISIVASKIDYSTNSTKIRNASVIELMSASQDRRDIPLYMNLEPCDAGENGQNGVDAYTVSPPQSYNMGVNSGTFNITYETGSQCTDCIDIYNHRPGQDPMSGVKIFTSGQVATNGLRSSSVSFSNGSVITIIVTTGPQDGSVWSYHIDCPY